MELQWWSIEVFDGAELSAARWQDSYGEALVEAAITHGAYEWQRRTLVHLPRFAGCPRSIGRRP
jgi:uncharacterized membrane protein